MSVDQRKQPITSTARAAKPAVLWLVALTLVVGTILVYWPAMRNGFVSYDDPDYITRNSLVRQGITWQGLAWAFGSLEVANWHPLAWVSHMIDCEIHGVDPRGHHFTSIFLHAVSAASLLLLLVKMTGMLWRSALIAALFAVHPQHVQSVAWISERKDVLSVLLGFITLLMYVSYTKRGGFNRYLMTLALFALTLMAKPMLVSLPVLMMLLDIWPLNRFRAESESIAGALARQFKEKLPFFLLALASCIVTVIAQKRGGTVGSLDMIPLDARLANAIVAYAWYVKSTFWPTNLAVFYPHPGWWPISVVWLSALVLLVITAGSLLLAKRKPMLIVGWLWFVISLLPVIGIVQVGSQAYADRYSYLPHVGLFMMVVFAIPFSANKFARIACWALGIASIVACIIATRIKLPHWFNSQTLYERAISVTQDNWLAHLNLGNEFLRQKRPAEAEAQFRAALQIRPNMPEAHYGRGQALAQLGRMDEANTAWLEAERLNPAYAEPRYSRALAMLGLGRMDEALALLDESLRLNPKLADAHLLRGIILMDQGRTAQAMDHLQTAVRLAPDNKDAANELRAARAKLKPE